MSKNGKVDLTQTDELLLRVTAAAPRPHRNRNLFYFLLFLLLTKTRNSLYVGYNFYEQKMYLLASYICDRSQRGVVRLVQISSSDAVHFGGSISARITHRDR